MVTGELKSQIDGIWNSFWSGGISNPLEVIEQMTYLLFLKRLDDLQTLEENKARRLGEPLERRIFPDGDDDKGRPYQHYRWSQFKNMAPAEMYTVISEHVFPWLRTLGGEGSTYATHMRDARFTIPSPGLLQKAVDGLDKVPMTDRDTKGDVYEYMLSKIATAGQNGQFRTPRHIIQLMVEMVKPTPTDVIIDPACGTCGFLIAAGEYIRDHHPEALRDAKLSRHFHEDMFNGFDFDNTMLRIGSMNMLLHGVEHPDVHYKDSLAEEHAKEDESYTLVLANPPFAGSLDYETVAKDLLQVVKTKKTELLFLVLFIRLLKPGGRAAVIVPDGALFGSTNAHKELRRMLVEDQKLDGIVSLPSGVFRPYAGVSTAILLFTIPAAPTTSGTTTSKPTAAASTTNAQSSSPPPSSGPRQRSATRNTRRTTCLTPSPAGPNGTAPNGNEVARSKASAFRRLTSSPTATTSALTDTKNSCTSTLITATPARSSRSSRR